jgi:chromosome segregation ATPase
MDDWDARDVLSSQQAELDSLLEQIDEEQEIADVLQRDVASMRQKLSELPPRAKAVRFAAPPEVQSSNSTEFDIQSLNERILSIAAERRVQHSRLEKLLQRRSQLKTAVKSSQETLSGLDTEIAAKSKRLRKNQRKLARAREFGAGAQAERLQCLVERVKLVEDEIAELDAQLATFGTKTEPISLTEVEEANQKLEGEVGQIARRFQVLGSLLDKWQGRIPESALTDESIDELLRKVEQRQSRGSAFEAERQHQMLSREIERFAVDEEELRKQIELAKSDSLECEHRLTEEIAQLRIEVAQLLIST